MQFHLLRALESRLGTATRIAPVEVGEEFVGKWISRFQKRLGIPRRYAHYSESRLASYAQAVEARLPANHGRPVIFFGALPFVKCQPAQPYFIYTDGAFFIHYWEYNSDHSHSRSDIDRIINAEAKFMREAAAVWCSSQWVASRIAKEYNIPNERMCCVGTGRGDVPLPVEPIRYEKFLVMIAADFYRKGGRLAVDAVAEARKQGADLGIKFIGARPPNEVMALPFVEWCGWLDLQKDTDRARFADIMSRAGAHILLSRADLTPLVILEAAVYGKATIATAVGGIPEMIVNGKTGWLVEPTAQAGDIGRMLFEVFADSAWLRAAGQAANCVSGHAWNWAAVAEKAAATLHLETVA
jgi:glycosyltransferase involved in cell wall biosynthesis